jgi:hypothetical protein
VSQFGPVNWWDSKMAQLTSSQKYVTSRARLRAPPCLHVGPISLRVHCALCGYGRQPQHQGEVKLSAREWL